MSDGSFWKESNVLVTGGASFIGSHIVDKLVTYGANVTVLDDLSSGRLENLTQSLGQVKFVTHNLEYNAKDVLKTLYLIVVLLRCLQTSIQPFLLSLSQRFLSQLMV